MLDYPGIVVVRPPRDGHCDCLKDRNSHSGGDGQRRRNAYSIHAFRETRGFPDLNLFSEGFPDTSSMLLGFKCHFYNLSCSLELLIKVFDKSKFILVCRVYKFELVFLDENPTDQIDI